MPTLQRLPSGALLGALGKLYQECCCNCEGNEPASLFSFTQTSSDPCTFNFFDESVPNVNCDSLVYWQWEYFDDPDWVPFSNQQNPEDEELPGEGPWQVRLTVRDACGCVGVSEMTVPCYELVTVACCSDTPLPAEVTVTMSGWSDLNCAGAVCNDLNGTFVLAWTGAVWTTGLTVGPRSCNNALQKMSIRVVPCNSGFFQVLIQMGNTGTDVYTIAVPDPCRGTHVFNYSSSTGQPVPEHCNRPATVTVTI